MVDPDIGWSDFLLAERNSGSPVTDASLIVARWLAHVPPSQIHVVTVPPPGADPTVLLHRFAAALRIDTTAWPTDAGTANRSLDTVQVELLRRLNRTTSSSLDRRAQRRLVGSLLPRLRAADRRRRMRLPESEREWIESETARRTDVLRRSGATIHGDLADLKTPGDAWEDTPLDVCDEDLLDEALQLLVATHPDLTPDRLDIV